MLFFLATNTAITNELTDHLSVRFSYTFTYDTSPVQGYVATDHTGLVTLVAKVL